MSTKTQTQSRDCRRCGTSVSVSDSVAGQYCSRSCYYRQKGESVLDQLDVDSTICSTCFEPIIHDGNPPYETPTGVDVVDEIDGELEPLRKYETKTGCICGAVDPSDRHGFIQESNGAGRTAVSLFRALWKLAEKGAIDGPPDRSRFVDYWKDHPTDWALIAGAAVYADRMEGAA